MLCWLCGGGELRGGQTGAEANCTKPICCRNFADATGTPTEPAGPNGNSKCDSPVVLADSMLAAAQEFAPEAKFTLFTGDVVEGECGILAPGWGDLMVYRCDLAR